MFVTWWMPSSFICSLRGRYLSAQILAVLTGSAHADRSVPRTARRAHRRDPHVRTDDHLAPGGGRGDRLVRAADLARARRRRPRDHGERAAGGVQALRDEPRVDLAAQPKVPYRAPERPLQ